MKRRLFLRSLTATAAAAAVGPAAAADGVRTVVYSTAGGQRLALDIRQPIRANGTGAVVLCLHGGAWRGGRREDMAPFAAAFAEAGYTAVSASYRLFDPAKHPENVWPAAFVDVQRAVRWLRENARALGIDPGRIAALGASAGGHLAALLGTRDTLTMEGRPPLARHSSRVNAVIDVFGPSDLTKDFSALRLGAASVQDLVDDFIGRGREGAARDAARREASPVFHVDARTAPFLVFHGARDAIVPVEQSRLLTAALRRAQRPCQYVEWPKEGHGVGAPGTLESFRRECLAFLATTFGR